MTNNEQGAIHSTIIARAPLPYHVSDETQHSTTWLSTQHIATVMPFARGYPRGQEGAIGPSHPEVLQHVSDGHIPPASAHARAGKS